MTGIAASTPQGLIKRAGTKISRFDAEQMLSRLLGTDKVGLYLCEKGVPVKITGKFGLMVEQRAQKRPLQYILGETGFMGLDFKVNPDVLIPRPETELLVEEVIRVINSARPRPTAKNPVKILDLGTGSGNIAISLTKYVTNCKIIASDVSKKALFTAKKNALINGVSEKIDFILSDLFGSVPSVKFDIIASNPPYVASARIGRLQREISFEPRTALEAGADGLDFYRRIVKEAGRFLKKNGILALELGFGQAQAVKGLLDSNGYSAVKEIKDYNYIKRVVTAEWIR